jgi:NAD(P)-dependent dehydrogenase (short-subunit alcohol dehydrogenase family)
VLIVGANSNISIQLVSNIRQFNPRLTLVSRNQIVDSTRSEDRLLTLNLSEEESILKFLDEIEMERFDLIYFFAGEVSDLEIESASIGETFDYYKSYAAGINFLIGHLHKNLDQGATLIFLSSRAAHRPSFDLHYSAVKASTEAFIRSIAQKCPSQRFLVLAPSLIEDTRIYKRMTEQNINAHKVRTSNRLLSVSEVVGVILQMSLDKQSYENGGTTCIGRDW